MGCEERIDIPGTLMSRECKGKGLVVVVHPGGTEYGTKVVCSNHARKLYASPFPWMPDWDETERRFGTKRPKDRGRNR